MSYKCIYAENLVGKHVTMTVESVRDSPDRLFCHNGYTDAWDIIFTQKSKDGRQLYVQIPKENQHGKSCMLLRQFRAASGGKDPGADSAGVKLVLFPVKSDKAATGEAIRIAKAEG